MKHLTQLTSRSPLSATLLLTALLAAGCGGGGGSSSNNPGGGGNGGGDDQQQNGPTADVSFPTAYAETDSHIVFVRGTTTSSEQIASIAVNGFQAQSNDGWATWRVKVLLAAGENVLTTVMTTQEGEELVDPDQQTVLLRSPLIGDLVDMAYSAGQGPKLWYLDDSQLLRHDLLTEELVTISGNGVGVGHNIEDPIALTVDPDGERAFVLCGSGAQQKVVAINTANGQRTRLDDPQPGFELDRCTDVDHLRMVIQNQPFDLLYLTSTQVDTLYVIDPNSGAVEVGNFDLADPVGTTAIDTRMDGGDMHVAVLDTSERLLMYGANGLVPIASHGDGLGEIWNSPTDVQILPHGDVLVTEQNTGDIYYVNTWTGQRSRLEQEQGVHGLELQDLCAVQSFAFDNEVALVAMDRGQDICAAVAGQQNEWEIIVDSRIGEGASMNYALGLARAGEDFLATSALPGEVLRIDQETGDRTRLANWNDHPLFHIPTAICTDEAESVAYFTEALMQGITAMDLETGAMGTVTGMGIGNGPELPFEEEVGLAYDSTRDRLLLAADDAIYAIDLQTGNRSVLSGPGVGQGQELDGAMSLALDLDMDWALVGCRKAIYAVSLTTGDRQQVRQAHV